MAEVSHDVEFQRKVLHLAATDHKFWSQYGALLDAEYFDIVAMKRLFEITSKLINECSKEVDLTEILKATDTFMLSRGFDTSSDSAIKDEARLVFKSNISNAGFITDTFLEFVKRQRFRNALSKAIDILERGGGAEEAVKELEDAAAVGAGEGGTGMTFADLPKLPGLYRALYGEQKLIKTGIPSFDRALQGGMAPGELHVIQAAPKMGKSTLGCNIGAYNLVEGKTVFHVTLEIKELDVLSKYACRLTGLTYRDILDFPEASYNEKIGRFDKYKPKLFVKYFTDRTANTGHIRAWISQVRAKHMALTGQVLRPDLIIIDYDDCLVPSTGSKDDMYEDAGQIYTDLIRLGDTFAAPILTFAQPKRDAWDRGNQGQLIHSYDLAHSAKKAHKAFSISSLNFAMGSETGILFADLLRRGESNVKVPVKRDLKRAYIAENAEALQIGD